MSTLSTEKPAIVSGPNPQPDPHTPTTFTEVLERITPDSGKVILLESDGGEIIQTYAQLRERATKMLGGVAGLWFTTGK